MTIEGGRLAQAHRLAQSKLGVLTVAQMLTIWPLLDVNDLDGSFRRWLAAVTPLVQAQRSASSRLAGNYYLAARAVGVGNTRFTPLLAEEASLEAISISMLVTGPASLRSNLARGMQLARAVDIAQARSAAAAMRHALNGGRQTILQSVKADDRAAGWERVTSGDPCDFCSMLADRGAVYSEDAADFEAHDHCNCGAEPIFH